MASRLCFKRLVRPAISSSRRCYATAVPASDQVHIVEVGPRDGLQNEKNTIPLDTKILLIERLATTGLKTIEAGSFVSPKWIPQMANSPKILEHILLKAPPSKEAVVYQFLVPNEKGMDNLLSAYAKQRSPSPPRNSPPTSSPSPDVDRGSTNAAQDPDDAMPTSADHRDSDSRPGSTYEQAKPEIEVSIFTAATETFTQKNTNCSIAESLDRFKPVFQKCKENDVKVRAYISVALGCPYEGQDVDPKNVAELAVNLLEMGSDEISVADTTGMGTAPRTRELLRTLAAAGIESKDLALHFHDTFGQALVNTVVGLEAGVRTFDCAVAGLGGCPYSPGATGNVASEDLVYLFENLGLRTGVDLVKLAEIGEWIAREVGKPNESHAGKATLARLRRDR